MSQRSRTFQELVVSIRVGAALLLALTGFSVQNAFAQGWSFDARKIGLGGVGSTANIAAEMIDEQRPYRSIVLPFGLIQVLRDLDKFDPTSDEFDPVRAAEYAASPLHYVVGRDKTDSGGRFVTDIGNAALSRDLNAYSGFVPANEHLAEGLASPSWGGTIKVQKGAGGAFQGVYIGAGPYLSFHTQATIDPQLTKLLASETPVYVPNTRFAIANGSQGQFAAAITGGYRGRFAWPTGIGSRSDREGLYVAVNYNYLLGFGFEDINLRVRLDTDGSGLLTVNPLLPSPIIIDRNTASSGRGFAVDVGVGAVVDRWELGFGVNGIANRIDWSDVDRTSYSLNSLVSGNDEFLETQTVRVAEVRVELPVDYRGNVGYDAGPWAAVAELGHGFQGTSFHGGYERRFDRIELRGGARYTREKWNPTGGAGFDLSPRVSIDVAAYGTTANIERKRQLAIAASLRLNPRR